ncbi:MAG: ABC transporter substrate-binding protein [Desulfovibrio sp.]|nr:ABC transporter substrate-binding protein [Desulfovibrio sp.]
MLKKYIVLFLAIVMLTHAAASGAAANRLVRVPTAWMDEFETFLMWYAKEKQWDKEVGLDIEMHQYNSGEEILSALPTGAWVYAGVGVIPAIMGNMRNNVTAIAIGADEAAANGVVVRADSAIAAVKGWNKDYPEVLGSPDTVRGKTFLVSDLSSSHYALSSWLGVLGLQDSDIIMRDMVQGLVVANFENRIGDGVALWAPQLYLALEKGGVLAADLKTCGKSSYTYIIANAAYANEHPEITAKFLSVYFKAVDEYMSKSPEVFLQDYRRFYLAWAGKDYDEAVLRRDMKSHQILDLPEQQQFFDESNGRSLAQKDLEAIARFFGNMGRLGREEILKIDASSYASDKFIKLVPPNLKLKK